MPTGRDLMLLPPRLRGLTDQRHELMWLRDPRTGLIEPVPFGSDPGPEELMRRGWTRHERRREPEPSYEEMLRALQLRAQAERLRREQEGRSWPDE
jgi:hypothetical protein